MRRLLFFLATGWTLTAMGAPGDGLGTDSLPPTWRQTIPESYPTLKNAFSWLKLDASHLDVSLTAGTTGIGLDLALPLSKVVDLRAGYAFMPHVKQDMHFGVDVGDDPVLSQSKFNRLSSLLEDLTGNTVDNQVVMEGRPTYWNWKLLVDMKPFRNKHWHLSAGVYLGNRQIGKAVNSMKDMPSLMAVNMYNTLYNKAMNGEPILRLNGTDIYLDDAQGQLDLKSRLEYYGKMSIYMGDYKEDQLYEEDVVAEYDQFIGDEYYAEGDVIHHKGDVRIAKGTPYRMTPDENSMVRAYAYANRVKPYLGFGYGGRLLKGDDSWHLSFDLGVMFWGGVPKVVTHDGTDLVNDITNVQGKVGDYIDLFKKFSAFPVLNLRITKRIF